jgi:hypothetical protein
MPAGAYARPVLDVLTDSAAGWARVGLNNIEREYPNDIRHTMADPEDRPTPRELHPAFYGSYDWHSCVEMHWMLVRLLRTVPDAVPDKEIRAVLDRHLTVEALAAEAAYVAAHPGWQRPYGRGWALAMADELAGWDDPDAQRWSAAFDPLADAITNSLLRWLPRAAYPVRHGVHPNSAFGLSRSFGYARAVPALADAIRDAAWSWFANDVDYPAHYEPSGADFLSPALTEAELMSLVLPADEFSTWLDRFLPGLASAQPRALLEPVEVSDPTDGQIAHLHGLNLSRAACSGRIARALPAGDPRIAVLEEAARRHGAASLDQAIGSDYMVEHWLAAYAVFLLT